MAREQEIYLYEKINKSFEYQIQTINTNMEKMNEIEYLSKITEKCDFDIVSVYFSLSKQNYPDEIKAKYLEEAKSMVQEKIYSLCQHQYIDDEIELPNEVIKKITYCEKCYHEIKK
jgi:hypothetical protein